MSNMEAFNKIMSEIGEQLNEETITAIKAALEAKVEPVAWREFDGEGGYDYFTYEHNEDLRDKYIERNGEKYASWVEPLYTTPPQRMWVGLTRTELIRCGVLPFGLSYELYESIEAKLKEKNNG